jgi:peptidoglycan/xylan/chitin deacetylase (PgdA/CDA1 family)
MKLTHGYAISNNMNQLQTDTQEQEQKGGIGGWLFGIVALVGAFLFGNHASKGQLGNAFSQGLSGIMDFFKNLMGGKSPSTPSATHNTEQPVSPPSSDSSTALSKTAKKQAAEAVQPITIARSGTPNDPIRLTSTSKHVSLSFDDGIFGEGKQGEQTTAKLLDYLKQKGVKATFFITTDTIDNPEKRELVKRMVREGHEVGVHSTNHDTTLLDKPDDVIRADVKKSKQFLETLIREESPDYRVTLFRPPGGWVHERYQKIVAQEGLAVAMWDIDTQDYKADAPSQVGQAAMEGIRAGRSNILMHNADLPANDPRFPHKNDKYRADGREMNVVENLEAFLPQLTKEGYRFSTMSEALRAQGIKDVAGGTLIGSAGTEAMVQQYTKRDKTIVRG